MNQVGEWRLSPAYDLTFSSGPGGEQSTMVMGEGKSPGLSHLRALGEVAGIRKVLFDDIIDQTRAALSAWPSLAKEYGVRTSNIRLIAERMAGADWMILEFIKYFKV